VVEDADENGSSTHLVDPDPIHGGTVPKSPEKTGTRRPQMLDMEKFGHFGHLFNTLIEGCHRIAATTLKFPCERPLGVAVG